MPGPLPQLPLPAQLAVLFASLDGPPPPIGPWVGRCRAPQQEGHLGHPWDSHQTKVSASPGNPSPLESSWASGCWGRFSEVAPGPGRGTSSTVARPEGSGVRGAVTDRCRNPRAVVGRAQAQPQDLVFSGCSRARCQGQGRVGH